MKCACGVETRVLETRAIRQGLRRRRVCDRCGVKTTTVEVRVPEARKWSSLFVLVLPRHVASAWGAVSAELSKALPKDDHGEICAALAAQQKGGGR